MAATRRLLCNVARARHRGCPVPAHHQQGRWLGTADGHDGGSAQEDGESQSRYWTEERHLRRYMELPPEQQFPYLHWGFRDGGEVKAWCLPTVMKARETMDKIPYSSVESQLESRGLTEGEFKEGAVLAYKEAAKLFSTPLFGRVDGGEECDRAGAEEGGGEKGGEAASSDAANDVFVRQAGEMVDEYLLEALRTQREAFRNLGWEPRVTTRLVRANPISVVVAPANSLNWNDESNPDGTRPVRVMHPGIFVFVLQAESLGSGAVIVVQARWALTLGRMMAVVGGLYRAMRGRGDNFCYLLDCHLEVEEDFELLDAATGEVVFCDNGSRDHVLLLSPCAILVLQQPLVCHR